MAGRPTKYNEVAQKKADKYADGGFIECDDVVPSVAGLAIHLGVTRSTIQLWAKENPRFSGTLDKLKAQQEKISLSGGLRGDLNATIVKLLLANHGYSEKQSLDHTSSDGSAGPSRIIIEAASVNGDDSSST